MRMACVFARHARNPDGTESVGGLVALCQHRRSDKENAAMNDAANRRMLPTDRIAYSAITDRPPMKLPGGAPRVDRADRCRYRRLEAGHLSHPREHDSHVVPPDIGRPDTR